MSDKTGIEWADATWNPIVGCSIVSKGCTNCYAMKVAHRLLDNPGHPHYHGTTAPTKNGGVWTGKMAIAPEHIVTQPIRWTRPRRVFVNSMGDLFHEDVPREWIDRVFHIMALTPWHTYMVLTKRAERMLEYLSDPITQKLYPGLPLPNVWLGVSIEDQDTANERIPHLLQTPAAIRFISAEPLLGPVDLRNPLHLMVHFTTPMHYPTGQIGETTFRWEKSYNINDPEKRPIDSAIDWVICGGESGPGARPMHPDWPRTLRDQCIAAGVPFFFKQWGEWATVASIYRRPACANDDQDLFRFGKKQAGRHLDGRTWDEFPGAHKACKQEIEGGESE